MHHIAGEDRYLVKVRAADTEALGRLLRERFGDSPTVRSTRTTIVLSTVKESARVPLEPSGGRKKMNRFNVRLIAAFAAVYIIWGSTYLAIHFAIETIPPLLMAGVRFLIAGALTYGVLRARGAVAPTRANWKAAAVVGGLLLLGGNGALVWGEQHAPSGLAALLIATVPLWMVLLHWLARGPRPTGQVAVGLGLGLVGIAVLVGPSGLTTSSASLLAMVLILVGSLAWAAGSVYARNAPLPASPLMGTALEMLAGGAMLVIVGSLMGSGPRSTRRPSRSARCWPWAI